MCRRFYSASQPMQAVRRVCKVYKTDTRRGLMSYSLWQCRNRKLKYAAHPKDMKLGRVTFLLLNFTFPPFEKCSSYFVMMGPWPIRSYYMLHPLQPSESSLWLQLCRMRGGCMSCQNEWRVNMTRPKLQAESKCWNHNHSFWDSKPQQTSLNPLPRPWW